MAQTPEQNRRYQAALRRVLARLRTEQPATYRRWLVEALEEVTQRPQSVHNGSADGGAETCTRR